MMPRAHPPRPARSATFGPDAFAFLRGLARHNTRAWFEANRPRYEMNLRAPMAALVEELDVRLAGIAPEIVGDPRRSMFRIHRDVRFSRDKSPYKTNAGCWFYHQDAGRGVGQDAEGGAGYYFHLEPSGCFVAAGIWMPGAAGLAKIRTALAERPTGFAALLQAPAFRRRYGRLSDEAMLTRLPRGYAPGHPAEAWLRYKSFTVSRALPTTTVTSPRLAGVLARDFEALRPLVRWLNAALGLPARDRRY
jgi:uncharacterized protein (TIGR02453 family)